MFECRCLNAAYLSFFFPFFFPVMIILLGVMIIYPWMIQIDMIIKNHTEYFPTL